jgi:hypothetical protein
VESFRRPDGKPTVRVLLHADKGEGLLARLQPRRAALRLRPVVSGAFEAAFTLAKELGCAEAVNAVIPSSGGTLRRREGS